MKSGSAATGFLILILAWVLAVFAGGSFALHMASHMGVVAVAAPLFAMGLSGTRYDVSFRLTWVTPITASLIELVVVWFWHLPQLRALAEKSLLMACAEQASFLGAGLLLWLACLGAARRNAQLAGVIGLLLTSMHMTLLGVLLALAPRPLYGTDEVMCFGVPLGAAADQQIGGVVMLFVGAASYLIGGIALLYRLIAGTPEPARQP